jgi:hypothetical protein
MSLRFSLLLLAIGAAITFLVDYQSQGVDIRILGYVFTAGGAGGLVIALAGRAVRRSSQTSSLANEPNDEAEQRREARIRDRV